MERRISYYDAPRDVLWPAALKDEFSQYLGPYYFVFPEGSDAEAEFSRRCSKLGLKVLRRVLVDCTGKDLHKYPYYYLSAKRERDRALKVELERACDGGGDTVCYRGQKQISKVTLDLQKSKRFDLMLSAITITPQIYLVSRRLKSLMNPLHLTGCEWVPCLKAAQRYSEEEFRFGYKSQRLEEEADYFQLVITARTLKYPYNGNIVSNFWRCPRCGIVRMAISDRNPCFQPRDLNSTDFQYYSSYRTENHGEYEFDGQVPIISVRVLKLFIENKIKMDPFWAVPRIRYGVVEIREDCGQPRTTVI